MADLSGPLFNTGEWHAAVGRYGEWAEHQGALFADQAWHEGMHATFQNPTGLYESTVKPEGSVVHDTGLIYNFWLEGIGSRNAPVTRFPGYHNARQAAEATQERIVELVSPIPAEFITAMGGGR